METRLSGMPRGRAKIPTPPSPHPLPVKSQRPALLMPPHPPRSLKGRVGIARLPRSSVQAQLPTELAPPSAHSQPCRSHGALVHTSGHVLVRSGRCVRAQSGLHRRSGEPTEAPLRRKAETDRVREGISEGFRSAEPGRVAPGGAGASEPWHTCTLRDKQKGPLV